MKTLYLDVFSGLSGDMFIGALLDLGADFRQLEYGLARLNLDGYRLEHRRAAKCGIEGVKFDVHLTGTATPPSNDGPDYHALSHGHSHSHGPGDHGHAHSHGPGDAAHEHDGSRNFRQIKELIRASTLSDWVKEKSIAVFHRIAVAEGKIHGMPPEQVHFHEVGAVDSIVDIVGGCLGLELLGCPRVVASGVVEGTGWVRCAHGRMPLPAPATLEILGARGVAISQCEEPRELLTPTGAALLAEFAESFGPMAGLVAAKVGYGVGTRDNDTRPNVVRAALGEVQGPRSKVQSLGSSSAEENKVASAHDWETDTVAVLETNLDDVSGELLGAFVEQALSAGALDVFHTPIQMKKNRPGVLLTVLCAAAEADKFAELILRETSAFGVRRTLAERRKLKREFITVKLPAGEVTVKLGWLDGAAVQVAPEFEACRQVAAKSGLPLKAIYEAALIAARAEVR
ncbi:MAG: nickel pincer cofactor biosynthesis protein LarC [Proteobacteria bacterium]|nr:nickel pincer cofactor biosynthesis protein LarC [Pseudomonadota bacterium]